MGAANGYIASAVRINNDLFLSSTSYLYPLLFSLRLAPFPPTPPNAPRSLPSPHSSLPPSPPPPSTRLYASTRAGNTSVISARRMHAALAARAIVSLSAALGFINGSVSSSATLRPLDLSITATSYLMASSIRASSVEGISRSLGGVCGHMCRKCMESSEGPLMKVGMFSLSLFSSALPFIDTRYRRSNLHPFSSGYQGGAVHSCTCNSGRMEDDDEALG